MNEKVCKKVKSFFAGYRSKFYKKGEILIYAGDSPSGVFFVEKGLVKQYAISSSGEEMVVNIFKEASFFPMSIVINETQNPYYYEALTDIKILKAPKIEVHNYILNNSDVIHDLLSRVYKGIDVVLAKQVLLMSGTAYSLLLFELIICVQRFDVLINKEGQTESKIYQEDLAQQTGLARETVSRVLHIFQKKGLIIVGKGKIIIPDIKKLQTEVKDIF